MAPWTQHLVAAIATDLYIPEDGGTYGEGGGDDGNDDGGIVPGKGDGGRGRVAHALCDRRWCLPLGLSYSDIPQASSGSIDQTSRSCQPPPGNLNFNIKYNTYFCENCYLNIVLVRKTSLMISVQRSSSLTVPICKENIFIGLPNPNFQTFRAVINKHLIF